jgi:Flp pilus assembly protein TadG
MRRARTLPAPGGLLRRFARDRDGVSAIEFAMILPFMLTLYLGGVEVGDGLAIQFKSTLAARTVADLASQYVSIDNAAMSIILNAATKVVSPYSGTGMQVTVSEISTNSSGQATVQWSDSLNGTARSVGSTITLPSALQQKNITIIYGEVKYPYTPSLGYVLTGTINIYESMYFYPRLSTTVTRVNS